MWVKTWIAVLQMPQVIFYFSIYYTTEQAPVSTCEKKKSKPRRPLKLFFWCIYSVHIVLQRDVESLVRFATPTRTLNISHRCVICPSWGVAPKSKMFFLLQWKVWNTYTCVFFMLFPSQALPVKYFWMLTAGICYGYHTQSCSQT